MKKLNYSDQPWSVAELENKLRGAKNTNLFSGGGKKEQKSIGYLSGNQVSS